MPKQQNKSKSTTHVLVWDVPTRVFHWLFVLAFTAAWIVSENDRFLYEHVFAGYVFFGLLIFRFLWGWIGSHYALFRSFAYDWPSVTAYLKGLLSGEADRHIGHNPAGALMVFDATRDLWAVAEGISAFFAHESCGKCFPCSLGTPHLHRLVWRGRRGELNEGLVLELAQALEEGSLCGLGQAAPWAVRSLLERFMEVGQ